MTLALRTKAAIGALALLALGLWAVLAAGPGIPQARAGGGCAHANDEPSEATTSELRQSIICLIQNERQSRGRSTLDNNSKLRSVAAAHNDVMLQQDCFEHQCSGEASLEKRLKNADYLKGDKWAFGEILGYETTPKKMVNAWMGSDYHRENILRKRWDDLGVGAGRGTPDPDKPDSPFVTYTVIFGAP